MKYLLCLWLLLPLATLAQTAPKGATQIAVQLADSGQVVWKRTAEVLTARGYGIKSSDKDLLTLGTEPRTVKRAGEVSLNAAIKGRTVTLSGRFDNHIGAGALPITNKGAQGSPYMAAWQEMQAVAQALRTSAAP